MCLTNRNMNLSSTFKSGKNTVENKKENQRGTRAAGPLRAGASSLSQESIDCCLKFFKRLIWTWRGLEPPVSVDQKNRRVANDVPVKGGHLPLLS
jgi:hypothetical protein